jgi:hypothetical protein
MILSQSVRNSARHFLCVSCFYAVLVVAAGHGPPLFASGFEMVTGGERRFIVTVTDEMLQKSPKWKADAPHPPLSARKAIRLATELKKKLVADTKVYEWKFLTAKLCRDSDPEIDRWYWRVEFEAKVRPGLPPDDPKELVVIVLMDGTVVQPVPAESADKKSDDAPQKNN